MWYSIGSFTFPASWAAILFSFFVTFLFLYFWHKRLSDWYSNAIFYFLIVWKLSIIIVDFQTVIQYPMTILYFNGGVAGYWIGLVVVLLYALKKDLHSSNVMIVWVVTVTAFEAADHVLLSQYVMGITQLVINAMLLFFFVKKIKGPQKEVWSLQLIVVFTLIQLLFNSFGGFHLTMNTWTYLLVMGYLIFLRKIRGNLNNE